jgi:hypothetical protein
MSVGNKYAGPVRLGARSIIERASKGKRATGPTFPPPKALPPRPKSSQAEATDE